MSKKSCPSLCGNTLYKSEQDFLDIQHPPLLNIHVKFDFLGSLNIKMKINLKYCFEFSK